MKLRALSAALLFVCFLGTSSLRAEDSTYNAGIEQTVGSVSVRQSLVWNADFTKFTVKLELLKVTSVTGWTYEIRKDGGINTPIEIRFSNGIQRADFKLISVPGFGYLDQGHIR